MSDAINPDYYKGFSNGAEASDILEHLIGNCYCIAKYAIRVGRADGITKYDSLEGKLEDIKKAQKYANREVERLEKLIAEEKKANEKKADEEKVWQDWDKSTIIYPTEGEYTFTLHETDKETLASYFGVDLPSPSKPEFEEPKRKGLGFRAVLPYLHAEGFEAQWGTSEDETIVEADLTVRMEVEDYGDFFSINQRLSHPAYQDFQWVLSYEKK